MKPVSAVNRQGGDRVLITGGAGFVGGHLSQTLLDSGRQVTIVDNLSAGRLENVAHLLDHPAFTLVEAPIEAPGLLPELVAQVDVVYHLAAVLGVNRVTEDPVNTIKTNVMGTELVLDAALEHGAKVLVASTSEVYGKAPMPVAEDHDVVLGATRNSRWGYAASKMIDEFLALGYQRQFGVPVVVFRLFNTVGPRQTGRYGMVVPRFVRAALRGEPITVYGDGAQSRCFGHVLDVVDALRRLAETPGAVGEVVNVGNGREPITMLELAELVRETVVAGGGPKSEIVFVSYKDAYPKGFEDMRERRPHTHKIKELTGWEPTRTLDDILADVIEWEQARVHAAA